MKNQVLMSVMVIGVTSMLMGTGTFACFHEPRIHMGPSCPRCGNLLEIRDQDEWWGHSVTATWTAENMLPGDNYPFRCRFVGLKKNHCSPPANYIKITCDYSVIEEIPQTESDTDPYTHLHPDSMAKHLIITRCKYLGWGPCTYINCLTNPNPEWCIQDTDQDEKITFYDFKNDPLDNLPSPEEWWSRDWFVLSVKFDEHAGNDFQGDVFDLTLNFIPVE